LKVRGTAGGARFDSLSAFVTADRAKIAALLSIESEPGRPSEENTANAAITQTEAAEALDYGRTRAFRGVNVDR
jgi:hypothetical protein